MSESFNIRIYLDQIPNSIRRSLRYGLIAGVATAVITLFLPNQYRSAARILPADSRGGSSAMGQMAAAAAVVGVAIPGQDSSDLAFVDIVNSRWMAKKLLLENFQFKTKSWYFGRPRERRETLYSYLKIRNIDRGVAKMREVLRVSRDLKSKLLTISAETDSPELSQQIVQQAVANLEQFVQVKAQTRGGNKAAFAAGRLKEAQAEDSATEQEFQVFLDAHRNYATSNEPSVRLKGARLENALKLRQQVVMTLTINYEQALLEEKNDMPILNILDPGDVPIDKSGPARSMIVALFSLLGAVGTWGWLNREWLLARLGTSHEVGFQSGDAQMGAS